jgi:apyrase
MIDAGSTGSRAHIHSYKTIINKLPIIEPSNNKKIKPGLSSYASRPIDAKIPMVELIEFLKTNIPMQYWTTTPVHLQATAGLRAISPFEAEAILETVRDTLLSSPFQFERSWAKIISGTQEGINGWITANYLLHQFEDDITVGVVEMGGNSVQLTYAPNELNDINTEFIIPIDMNGNRYHLYTYSYLEYGLQAAEKLFQKSAIDSIEEKGNPCYPRLFRHSSAGNFKQCFDSFTNWITKKLPCSFKTCSFNGIYQPDIKNEIFLAIENFYYTSAFFGDTYDEDKIKTVLPKGNLLIDTLKKKGSEYCNTDWKTIGNKYSKNDVTELSVYCFATAYQSWILEHGFGFDSSSNIRPARLIHGKPIDWELGAILLELNNPIISSTIFNHTDNNKIFCDYCMLIIGIVLVVTSLLCYGYTRYHKKSILPYSLNNFSNHKV